MIQGTATKGRNLVQECRAGRREAFRLLYNAHRNRAYSVALNLLWGDQAAAEDACQEAFLKAFKKLGSFHGDAEFGTWLHRIVVNVCLDELRRRGRQAHGEETPERPDTSVPANPERSLLERERNGQVMNALAALKPNLREVVFLRYLEERSYGEIAAEMGVPPGTVAAWLSRALKAMGRKLADLEVARGETGR